VYDRSYSVFSFKLIFPREAFFCVFLFFRPFCFLPARLLGMAVLHPPLTLALTTPCLGKRDFLSFPGISVFFFLRLRSIFRTLPSAFFCRYPLFALTLRFLLIICRRVCLLQKTCYFFFSFLQAFFFFSPLNSDSYLITHSPCFEPFLILPFRGQRAPLSPLPTPLLFRSRIVISTLFLVPGYLLRSFSSLFHECSLFPGFPPLLILFFCAFCYPLFLCDSLSSLAPPRFHDPSRDYASIFLVSPRLL